MVSSGDQLLQEYVDLCLKTYSMPIKPKSGSSPFDLSDLAEMVILKNSNIITGIVITACLPIHRNGRKFEGVACVDMLMRDLISHLTAFPNLDVGYTLMLDSAGKQMVTVVEPRSNFFHLHTACMRLVPLSEILDPPLKVLLYLGKRPWRCVYVFVFSNRTLHVPPTASGLQR